MRARRLFSSWSALAAFMAVLAGGSLIGLNVLVDRVERRARDAAIETSLVVTALTVGRNLPADAPADVRLSDTELADLDGDVAVLAADHLLVGLEVWAADGRLVYADAGRPAGEPPVAVDRAALRRDVPWVMNGEHDRGVDTVDAHVPFGAGSDGTPSLIVKVLLPDTGSRDVAAASRNLSILTVTALVFGGIGLWAMRRRLTRRERDARQDRLTGLMNRAGFRVAARRVIAGISDSGELGAMFLLDLDGFKSVNDTLGHTAGDSLLAQVGERIVQSVRPGDVVARVGGDQYVVLMTGLADRVAAVRAAEHVVARLEEGLFDVDGVGLGIEASVGVAVIPTHGTDVDLLLRHVDVAMYRAKRSSAGIAVYDEAIDQHNVAELRLLGELRAAIDNDELVLHYQPKASLSDRHVDGVEALVRWNHPSRGLILPDEFIPLAESTGLLGPLTRWVLTRAVHDAAHWHRGGLSLAVAVNVSPRSLLDANLCTAVVEILAASGLPSRLLEIEVVETAIMTDPHGSMSVLRQLRAIGVRISIDDFGSGYTSLAYLKDLPVDALKIDQAFVVDLLSDDKGQAITHSIIEIGHRLGLTVLAEGIENEATWNQLARLGCDQGQGYYLARAMPAGLIEGWLTVHHHALEEAEPAERHSRPES